MEGSDSKQGMTRKAAARDESGGGSQQIPARSAWKGNASAEFLGVVRMAGRVSILQPARAALHVCVADAIASRSTRQSRGSIWIAEIAACFSNFSDGIASASDGYRGVLMNSAGLLYGFPRETGDMPENPVSTHENPTEFRGNPPDKLAIPTVFRRFQQEIAPFRRTKKKIRRETVGQNLGVSGIQTPVDRAQACSSKHPDGYREVPF